MVSTPSLTAPAWRGSWINAWLSSLGVARVAGVELAWTDDPDPAPVFRGPRGSAADVSIIDMIASAFPTVDELSRMAIATSLDDTRLPRNPSLEEYRERARISRASGDPMLGATMTDLTVGALERLEHSPFDPTMPGGVTLHDRVMSCRSLVSDPVREAHQMSFAGTAIRVAANGLGFDSSRITEATSSDSGKYVDAVVECWAFAGIGGFAVRGYGLRSASTRGWATSGLRAGAFAWPTWSMSLDWPATDALLDEFHRIWWASQTPSRSNEPVGSRSRLARALRRLQITTVFDTNPYRPTGTADSTRGLGHRLRWIA